MSITTETDNTWKNIENNYPPNIEPPIDRDSDIERCIIHDTTPIEATTIHNIKEPDNYVKEQKSKFDENETIQPAKTNRIEDNDTNILHKIRKIPYYLYKNLNNKCLLCSSISYKKM